MPKLPDLEGLAIFAKVAQMKSFASAATELSLSQATVSKAISRVEARLGARLFLRTSRRLALTNAGSQLLIRAAHILAEGEAAEDEARTQSDAPRGLVRLAAPMSFGVSYVAPVLPEFLASHPDVSIDLQLNDDTVDMLEADFDAAIRISALPDSSLVAQTLFRMRRYLVGAPAYMKKHGRPNHPKHLAEHLCIDYAHSKKAGTWTFTDKNGSVATVRPAGPLRVNNGDAMMPALVAGTAIGILPEFFLRDAIADGRLERLLPDWSVPSGAVYWVTPPGGMRPKRVEVLGNFLARKLSPRSARAMTIALTSPEAAVRKIN
jgi:DNA-binding transcriptional LysR family regulator